MQVSERPIIAYENVSLQINYSPSFLDKREYLPSQKLKALKSFNEACSRHRLRLDQSVGDLVFINNLNILHARDAWQDSKTDPSKRRHVMRLHLHDEVRGPVPVSSLGLRLDGLLDLTPERQTLLTEDEWTQLPREWRTNSYGVSGRANHA